MVQRAAAAALGQSKRRWVWEVRGLAVSWLHPAVSIVRPCRVVATIGHSHGAAISIVRPCRPRCLVASSCSRHCGLFRLHGPAALPQVTRFCAGSLALIGRYRTAFAVPTTILYIFPDLVARFPTARCTGMGRLGSRSPVIHQRLKEHDCRVM